MECKTSKKVWHVKNLLKAAGILLVVCIGMAFLPMSGSSNFIFGLSAGIILMRICLRRWKLYHLEPLVPGKLDSAKIQK